MMVDSSDASIPARVSQLLVSRLCHDLISPVAAMSNGLELLDDGQGRIDGDVMALLNVSAGQAAGRLSFFRIAYGLGGDNADRLGISELAALIDGVLETGKISLDMPRSPVAPGQVLARIILNTALLGVEMMAGRGTVSVEYLEDGPVAVSVTADGPGAAAKPELVSAMDDGADIAALTPRTVQAFLTGWLVRQAGCLAVVEISGPDRVVLSVRRG